MFEQLHIVGDRAFEIRKEIHTEYVVRTYLMTEDGSELDPAELEFTTKELAESYIKIMTDRIKGEDE